MKSIDDKIDMLRINKAKAETDRAVLSEKIKSYVHYDENDFNRLKEQIYHFTLYIRPTGMSTKIFNLFCE